jgi:hypothetical protein
LLLDEKNELHNRAMHISGMFSEKADIETLKADICEKLADISYDFTEKTVNHIIALYEKFGQEQYFGRSDVEQLTGLKRTRASELLKIMFENRLTEPVRGHGKGKYHFL